jgi:hypothetical protein
MILRYHELARIEVIETTEYYARQRPELGAEFLAELTTSIDAILAAPATYEQVRPGVRRYLLERFPVRYLLPHAR